MTALVDANVVLDVMLAREPFLADSIAVLAGAEVARFQGLLCASTVTTIHYIARRRIGTAASLERLSALLSFFEIAPVNRAVLESALLRGFTDFEDAVLHEAAAHAGAACIVTRNVADFRLAEIPVHTPAGFIAWLDQEERR